MSAALSHVGGRSGAAQIQEGLPNQPVIVVLQEDVLKYQDALLTQVRNDHSQQSEKIAKIAMFVVAGTVMAIAGVAFVSYLQLVIPAAYVWPGISKLAVATGIAGLFLGSLYFLGSAYDLSREVTSFASSFAKSFAIYTGQNREIMEGHFEAQLYQLIPRGQQAN